MKEEKMHVPAEYRARVIAIATRLVEGLVACGEVDLADEAAVRKATQRCCRDAYSVILAAEEFLCG